MDALEAAARELLVAAGRPEALAWENLTDYERAAWREAAARTVLAFLTEQPQQREQAREQNAGEHGVPPRHRVESPPRLP